MSHVTNRSVSGIRLDFYRYQNPPNPGLDGFPDFRREREQPYPWRRRPQFATNTDPGLAKGVPIVEPGRGFQDNSIEGLELRVRESVL